MSDNTDKILKKESFQIKKLSLLNAFQICEESKRL